MRAFILPTSCSRLPAVTKSAPLSRKACTGAGAPLPSSRSRSTAPRSLAVMSGFCSEPESANSFSMIFRVRMNQEWSYPAMSSVVRRCRSVLRVS